MHELVLDKVTFMVISLAINALINVLGFYILIRPYAEHVLESFMVYAIFLIRKCLYMMIGVSLEMLLALWPCTVSHVLFSVQPSPFLC